MEVWEGFGSYVAELRRGRLSPAEVLERTRAALVPLLDEAYLPPVAAIAQQPGMPWLLHESLAVTIFVMSGAPGYLSSVHDHGSWGMVGQVSGEEVETRYRQEQGPDGLVRLGLVERCRMRPGDIVTILPPDRDIHQVATLGATRSVTVHAFAHDILAHGFAVFEPTLYTPGVYQGSYANRSTSDEG
jgi:predicted metal-dependent enzyme (double-stranded beta helix superfamily)